MIFSILKNNYSKIFIIILLSVIIDNLFILSIKSPPGWDQGYHISNVFKMFNIIDNTDFNFLDKANKILNVTNSYRGPLTYFLSALFLKLFGNSYHYAYLSNQIFNIICIISIFHLGKIINNESTGIWGSILFTFSSLILKQRTDYLIDLSLTSFSTLNLLFFSKWYFNNKNKLTYSLLSGISFGLIFLTKPTGIVLFCLPFLSILIKIYKDNINNIYKFYQIVIFIFSFTIVIIPWFSINWLTIITSTINAWNWGINYQEDLGIKSIESWFYYFKKIPSILGPLNSSILFTILFIEKIAQKNLLKIKLRSFNNINFWFSIFFLNCYLITSLMSTKDIRFILPLYPLICIYLAIFLNDNKYKIFSPTRKKNILIISLLISILISNNQEPYFSKKSKSIKDWPHSDIIQTIQKENPNLVSTLAILPDTKEINTFNIEAEASKQGEYVAARQIISNKKTYKDDLKYFDWFLIKTGDQGIMFNESKKLLNQYLNKNNSFVIHKEWDLPDNSKVILLRRKILNTYLREKNCNLYSQDLNIKQINNGINISLIAKGENLKSSYLLLDFIMNESKEMANVSFANGLFHSSFNTDRCYYLSQNISIDLAKNLNKNILVKSKIIDKDHKVKFSKVLKRDLILNDEFINNNYIQMANRISEVETLGNLLRKGEFNKLFNLVGIINQSDPKQIYLYDAEKIYMKRYQSNKNLKDLYSILISQILQRKVHEAEKTLNIILDLDKNNGNTLLTKSILNIYAFDRAEARISIDVAKNLKMSRESHEILQIAEGLTYILEMKFLNAYRTFI